MSADETARAYEAIDYLIDVGETQGANPDDSMLLASSQDILDELGDSYRGYRVARAENVEAAGVCLVKRIIPEAAA